MLCSYSAHDKSARVRVGAVVCSLLNRLRQTKQQFVRPPPTPHPSIMVGRLTDDPQMTNDDGLFLYSILRLCVGRRNHQHLISHRSICADNQRSPKIKIISDSWTPLYAGCRRFILFLA